MNRSVLGLLVVITIIMIGMPILQSSVVAQNASTAMISGVLAHSLTDSEANTLSSNGIRWIRSDVSLDTSSNWYSIYQLAIKNHLSLIGTLDPYTMGFDSSSNLSDWNRTIQNAVGNFSDVVKVWEIWNEPTNNNSGCGNFFAHGNATEYVDLMKVAYQIIKANNPNAIVLGFGGLSLNADDSTMQQALSFAQQVVNNSGLNYCDAISLHAYPNNHYSSYVENSYRNNLATYRSIAVGKEVWITETGQHSGYDSGIQYSPQEQADYLNASNLLFKYENVKAYIWFELNDNNTGNSSADNSATFGLYNIASAPNIALGTYFSLVNPPPSPTPTPTPTLAPTATSTPTSTTNPSSSIIPSPTIEFPIVIAVAIVLLLSTIGVLTYKKKGWSLSKKS